jgi:hypothetical protein
LIENLSFEKGKSFLGDCSADLRKRIENAISELTEKPFPMGCEKLKGAANSSIGWQSEIITFFTRYYMKMIFKSGKEVNLLISTP